MFSRVLRIKVTSSAVVSFKQYSTTKRCRVVVTGLGVVSPLGCGAQHAWNRILSGDCGIVRLPEDRYGALPCKIAGLVKKGDTSGELNINLHFADRELRTMSPATVYAMIAAKEALEDSNWFPEEEEMKQQTGVAVGMGMVDMEDICNTNESLKRGYNRVSPYFVPRILVNMAAGLISIRYGFKGPNHAVSTACATGAHAIGDAYRFIQHGDAKVMICGATEASVNPISIAGFCRLRALSTKFNDEPMKASRPFDKNRDGFVMGEGSAILVLEELDHAIQRNAKIYAEVLGYGLSGDASHLTAPNEDGLGATLAMSRAINDAKLQPEDISYVNAHATSTPLGDEIEAKAISRLLGKCGDVAVSSTKGAHGHLLGAAGNLESVFTIMAVKTGFLPPNINIENAIDAKNVHFVSNVKREWNRPKRIALKNAFGFGGTNVSLCFSQYVS